MVVWILHKKYGADSRHNPHPPLPRRLCRAQRSHSRSSRPVHLRGMQGRMGTMSWRYNTFSHLFNNTLSSSLLQMKTHRLFFFFLLYLQHQTTSTSPTFLPTSSAASSSVSLLHPPPSASQMKNHWPFFPNNIPGRVIFRCKLAFELATVDPWPRLVHG